MAERRISRTWQINSGCYVIVLGVIFADQCKFFKWADDLSPTGDKHLDEVSEISSEYRWLQKRINLIQEHDTERLLGTGKESS